MAFCRDPNAFAWGTILVIQNYLFYIPLNGAVFFFI